MLTTILPSLSPSTSPSQSRLLLDRAARRAANSSDSDVLLHRPVYLTDLEPPTNHQLSAAKTPADEGRALVRPVRCPSFSPDLASHHSGSPATAPASRFCIKPGVAVSVVSHESHDPHDSYDTFRRLSTTTTTLQLYIL